jgi:hypothetical protein
MNFDSNDSPLTDEEKVSLANCLNSFHTKFSSLAADPLSLTVMIQHLSLLLYLMLQQMCPTSILMLPLMIEALI